MNHKIKVLVVNGSPKGEHSLTLQHSLYMLGQEKEIEWKVLQVGEVLSNINYEEAWLESTIADIEWSDAIIWNTPVYIMLVPWQLMRLFRIIKDAGRANIFKGKYATSMITCFHYHDNVAEDWLRSTSEDLGMSFIEGRTADNMDMLREQDRYSMRFFMREFLEACRTRRPVERKFIPLNNTKSPDFRPDMISDAGAFKTEEGDVVPKTVLLTDEYGKEGNLSRMIEVFMDAYPYPIEVVDINDFPYDGGCQGSLQCQLLGVCERKDGFQTFYYNLLNNCDVLVFGMNIEGRYFSLVWKLFLDRAFANGHRTSMMGKHTAYLVAGPLRAQPGLRQILEVKDNMGRENAVGIIGDEYENSKTLEYILRDTARRLSRVVAANYQKSVNFLGISGMKIFRDLTYSMRGVSKEDHRFYRKHGLYDFPQKQIGMQLFNVVMGLAFNLKSVRKRVFENIPELYIKKHKKIVKSGKP